MTPPIEELMIIDDDKDCNTFVKILVEKNNFANKVSVALDGEEAIAYLEKAEKDPTLIFVDLNMPKMNGWQFVEAFKKLGKSISMVMMLTVSTNADDRIRAENEGVHFINKPLTKEKLLEIINLN